MDQLGTQMNDFEFEGYHIPLDLLMMTGGGPETFRSISDWHIDLLQKHIGLSEGMSIVEIGCGIGRDAIPLTKIIGHGGAYYGTDIIEKSITWCKNNISKSHRNFRFEWHDIFDSLHNPGGSIEAIDVTLDIQDASVDLVILQSVFTHMFEGEIIHYLREFERVLKPSGKVWASVFLVDDQIREEVGKTAPTQYNLAFATPYGYGCYINDTVSPRGAVAYDRKALERMVRLGGLVHSRRPLLGSWSGIHQDPEFGQDVLILERFV